MVNNLRVNHLDAGADKQIVPCTFGGGGGQWRTLKYEENAKVGKLGGKYE